MLGPVVALLGAVLLWPTAARADVLDAGADADAAVQIDATSAVEPENEAGDGGVPLTCGGRLCDTTFDSTCTLTPAPAPATPFILVAAAILPLASLVRRRRR